MVTTELWIFSTVIKPAMDQAMDRLNDFAYTWLDESGYRQLSEGAGPGQCAS